MISAIIVKTLREKRGAILGWTLGLLIGNFLIIQIFPPMREAFSELSANMPAELAGWFGDDGEIWTTLKGYIGLEVVGQMGLISVVFAIVFALSLLSAEEQNGTLMTQLSKPVSRTQLYLGKYCSLLIATLIVMFGFGLGAWLGTLPIDPMSITELIQPVAAVTLLVLAFASLTYAIAASGLGRTIAGVIVGVYALFGYFINAMQGDVAVLKVLSSITPYHYYNTPNVMTHGLDLWNVLVLLAVVIIPIIIVWPIFAKRDLKTR